MLVAKAVGKAKDLDWKRLIFACLIGISVVLAVLIAGCGYFMYYYTGNYDADYGTMEESVRIVSQLYFVILAAIRFSQEKKELSKRDVAILATFVLVCYLWVYMSYSSILFILVLLASIVSYPSTIRPVKQ